MDVICIGGPCNGKVIPERDDLRIGDHVRVTIERLYDPDEPVYLPYDDPRNTPTEPYSMYWFDGVRLVAP